MQTVHGRNSSIFAPVIMSNMAEPDSSARALNFCYTSNLDGDIYP